MSNCGTISHFNKDILQEDKKRMLHIWLKTCCDNTFTKSWFIIHIHGFLVIKLTHLPLVPHICQWTGPPLVKVMACRLFGSKPLPEPMLAYCLLDSWEQISVKFESEFYHFHSRKCIWKWCLLKWRSFCPEGDELNISKQTTQPFQQHNSRINPIP